MKVECHRGSDTIAVHTCAAADIIGRVEDFEKFFFISLWIQICSTPQKIWSKVFISIKQQKKKKKDIQLTWS